MPVSNRPVPQHRRYSEQEKAQAVRLVRQARAEGRGQGVLHPLAGECPERSESEQSQDEPSADGRALRVGGCVVCFADA